MAVLAEAISVVVQASSLDRCLGGRAAFFATVPNQTLCSDGELMRIGFMHPADVKAYVGELEQLGLRYLINGAAQDIIVVDQLKGLLVPCEWLEVGPLDVSPGKQVTACWLKNSKSDQLAVPGGWTSDNSLSSNFGFVAVEREKTLTKVAQSGGVEEYSSPITDAPLYIGRTADVGSGASSAADPEPTQGEVKHIETAWNVLEKITAAMGPDQEAELLKVKAVLWRQVRDAQPTEYSDLIAEGLAIGRIRDGIRKKLAVGKENNKFFRAYQDRGRAEAYLFGQKLVRWNRLLERRLIDRLFARKGPLEPKKLLSILDGADRAFRVWRSRVVSPQHTDHI